MAVSDYSTSAGANTSISGINIAENCSPANLNNAIRQMMADIKSLSNGLTIGTDIQAYDAGLQSIAGLTTAADRMIYTTGSDTYAVTTLTAAGRALLDDADAAAQLATLGAQATNATLTSLTGLSLVAGDVLYASGANTLTRLAKGVAGSGLQINSGATAPEWGFGTAGTVNTTTGAATVGPWDIPAGVRRFTVTSRASSLNGTGNILVQLRTGGSFVTTGYVSRSIRGTSINVTDTTGMVVSMGANAAFWSGKMDFYLHNPASNFWVCVSEGSTDTTASDFVQGYGELLLGGVLDGVRISSTAGTFDAASFNVFY